MNRSVSLRTVRQVALSSNDPTASSRLPFLSCWRCRLSSLSSAPTSLSFSSSSRLLHGSSAPQQSTSVASSRTRHNERAKQLSRSWAEERMEEAEAEEDGGSGEQWAEPPFHPTLADLTDLMAVARTGASDSAMESPLHQTLVALVESGDLRTALTHLRSLHRTASADSWNWLLSAVAQRRQFEVVAEIWRLWQSVLPPLDSPLPVGYNRLLLPNATTYGLLLRSPTNHRLLTASDALHQLKSRSLPVSTFIYNTLIKEHVHAKDYASARSIVDLMDSDGVAHDIYTISMRFTVFSKTCKWLEPARKYEEACVLWDDLMALQLPRIPLSLGFAFVWHICGANDCRRLLQLVQAIVNTSGPPDVVHQARPVELMLGCLMKNDRLREMIQLYHYMRRVGFKMTYKHFFVLVAGFARQGETNGMMRVFNEMVGHGVQPDSRLFETMLQAYGKVGDEEAAVRMIRRMSEFGVQPTIDCVCAIAKGINERHTALRADAAIKSEAQTEVSDVAETSEQTPSSSTPSSFTLPPLSFEYLPLFELADELSMTPAPYMYHRLLQTLREENDLGAMLFFLCDMKHKAVPVCRSELQWVLSQLSQLAQSPSAHVRLMAMQASLIVDGEENSLGALSSSYLLSMYIGLGDVASMQRVYRSIHERKIRVTWDIYLRMMQQCLQADSSDVREHERMQFITQVYSHLRASEQKFGESIYNEVLQAYAVLGDMTSMKAVLAAMRRDGVAMGEATLVVLDEAREHVEYTADITNYVTQQRNRIATLQMENNLRLRHKAELRQAAATAGIQRAEPTRLAAIDAPTVKPETRSLFALPEWSPLYDQTEAEAEAERKEEAAAAAAVEELQSALSAFLASLPAPIVHAQHFPAADVSDVQPLDYETAAGPTAKELSTIHRKLKTLQQKWPVPPEQKKQTEATKSVATAHTEPAAETTDQSTGSSTRIQPIDAPQQPPLRSAFSSAPRSSRATSFPASPIGLLSLSPQPGHIDLSTRAAGSVMRVTRCGTIGRLPRFSLTTVDTVTSRRMKAAVARRAEEWSRAEAAAPIEHSADAVRSPALPLPAARASSLFFTAIESQADTVAVADGGKRKKRARKTSASATAAESGASGAKNGRKQRDPYHGGWADSI